MKFIDLTIPLGIATPPWPTYEPLQVKYFKRLAPNGANGQVITHSNHLGTHLDGEIHFHTPGKDIASLDMEYLVHEAAVVDLSDVCGDYDVYTSKMVEERVDVRQGDILIIHTGYHHFGWDMPTANEIRYMVKHPGPDREFADWAKAKKLRWIGVDCGSADHPMNTIQRLWHPKTFEEANRKLIEDFGKDWDEMFPLDKYYQDTHLNLFPKRIVHAENFGKDIAKAESGRYYIGCYLQKGMEIASMWGRFVAFREGGS